MDDGPADTTEALDTPIESVKDKERKTRAPKAVRDMTSSVEQSTSRKTKARAQGKSAETMPREGDSASMPTTTTTTTTPVTLPATDARSNELGIPIEVDLPEQHVREPPKAEVQMTSKNDNQSEERTAASTKQSEAESSDCMEQDDNDLPPSAQTQAKPKNPFLRSGGGTVKVSTVPAPTKSRLIKPMTVVNPFSRVALSSFETSLSSSRGKIGQPRSNTSSGLSSAQGADGRRSQLSMEVDDDDDDGDDNDRVQHPQISDRSNRQTTKRLEEMTQQMGISSRPLSPLPSSAEETGQKRIRPICAHRFSPPSKKARGRPKEGLSMQPPSSLSGTSSPKSDNEQPELSSSPSVREGNWSKPQSSKAKSDHGIALGDKTQRDNEKAKWLSRGKKNPKSLTFNPQSLKMDNSSTHKK